MQILHPFAGPVQLYLEQLADPDRHRPAHCPQCQAKHPLIAHGFHTPTLIDSAFDGEIRVRRYLCQACRRTVSLLPAFALPYLRSSVAVIAIFLIARLVHAKTLAAALPPAAPYQRGQFWLRRFRAQAEPPLPHEWTTGLRYPDTNDGNGVLKRYRVRMVASVHHR